MQLRKYFTFLLLHTEHVAQLTIVFKIYECQLAAYKPSNLCSKISSTLASVLRAVVRCHVTRRKDPTTQFLWITWSVCRVANNPPHIL